MRSNLMKLGLVLTGVLASGCGGKSLESKDELTSTFAYAAVPFTHAKGAVTRMYQSGIEAPEKLPQPAISVKGTRGGEAVLKLNPVGVVVGLLGRGVMVDIEYKGYSEDGMHWMDGDISALTQFDYVGGPEELSHADIKIGLVGELGLTGLIRDALDLNVALTTRFEDLNFRDESVSFRVDGSVETPTQTFEWSHEDLETLWEQQQAEQ